VDIRNNFNSTSTSKDIFTEGPPEKIQSTVDIEEITGGNIEESLLRGTGNHIRFQFWDGPTKLDCKVFFC
jgi:hypothetical protein